MRILVVVAHPDDETMLSGGTLALLAKAGAEVHYLCATRGEGGDLGEPPMCSRDEVGQVREQEMVCAVDTLGGSSLRFMDYMDPTVGEDNELFAFVADEEEVAAQVLEEIREMDIDVVITHGSNGEYGHAAHLKVHQCVKIAVMSFTEKERPLLYSFQGAFQGHPKERVMNQDDAAHVILDIASVEVEKLAAITCHKTQHGLFLRKAIPDEHGKRSLRYSLMPLESLHRIYPMVERLPVQDALANLLAGMEGVRILDKISTPEQS
ncbi:MAG: PIG-L family deacetylase [Anaerolineaceae bacterium]|nr:PIG-L family deacetylase [Anaerolineaceae bacterium]